MDRPSQKCNDNIINHPEHHSIEIKDASAADRKSPISFSAHKNNVDPPKQSLASIDDSFSNWKRDAQALISSQEFHRAVCSTGDLIASTTQYLENAVVITPITLPMKVTCSVATGVSSLASGAISNIMQQATSMGNLFQATIPADVKPSDNCHIDEINCHEEKEGQGRMRQEEKIATNILFSAAKIASCSIRAISKLSIELISSTQNVLQLKNAEENVVLDNQNLDKSSSENLQKEQLSSIVEIPKSDDVTLTETQQTAVPFLRVCDLELTTGFHSLKKLSHLQIYHEEDHSSDSSHHHLLTLALDEMTKLAMDLALDNLELDGISKNIVSHHAEKHTIKYNTNPHILWKEEGGTDKLVRQIHSKWSYLKAIQMLEKEILTWSGRMTSSSSYGHKIPFFKARGIIPNATPEKVFDLLIDSSRVKLYNKHSKGRRDVCILNSTGGVITKIVQNQTKVPFSNKTICTTTIFHARKIHGSCNDYIIISRSIDLDHPANYVALMRNGEAATPGNRNEIIWGINIIRNVPGHNGDKVDFTTLTQANASAVPSFMAHKLGLMCISDFVKNVRSIAGR